MKAIGLLSAGRRDLWLVLALGVALHVAAADCVPSPGGLAGWWPGDTSAADIASTNNGALQGGASAGAAGMVGAGFVFDGTNAFVQIPDSPALRPTNLTIECWVRFASQDSAGSGSSPAGDQYIVFKQNSRSGNFEGFDLSKTRVGTSNVFRFAVSSAAGQSLSLQSATLISTGSWYHVAAVRGTNFLQLYVNGVLERQTTVSFPQDYGSHPLYFGTSGQSAWDHKLKGSLDEVSLYSRALASNEVAAIYAAGSAGKCKAPNITAQPLSQAVNVGSNATISVAATGFGTLSYQWRLNGTNLAAATAGGLLLTNVQLSDAGSYLVLVSNKLGTILSSNAVLTVLPPTCAPAPSGLAGWWPAEDNALDSAGANAAVLSGGAGFTNGLVGRAFDFDGVDGRAVVADAPALDFSTNDFSIEAWVRPLPSSPDSGLMTVVGKRSTPSSSLSLGYEVFLINGCLGLRLTASGTGNGQFYGPAGPDLRDGGFHHVAASVARNSPGGGQLFVDGQVVLTFDPTGQSGSLSTSEPLRIGNSATWWMSCFFKGQIDEVSLYSRALSAPEVQAVYGASTAGKCPWAPGVLRQPASQVASIGAPAVFQAVFSGSPPTSFRWQKDGADLIDGGNLSGAATATLTITGAQQTNEGTYRLTATNGLGGAVSEGATLAVVPVLVWGASDGPPAGTSNAVQIACGQWHNTALRADGRVVAWGWDSSGQSTVPESATNVIALAAGFEHTLALRMDGTLASWGRPELATIPVEATNIVAIAAGNYHSLALREDGAVIAWAYDNYYGPASVPATATNVVAIAGGGIWSLALNGDGTVLPWGDYRYGSQSVPSGLSNVVAIAAGFDIGLALRSDKTVAGWGVDFSVPPTGPGGLSNVVAMAVGSFHTLVLYPDETVYGWGRNFNGECNVPSYATNVLAIGGGDFDSLALVRDARAQLPPGVWLRSGGRLLGAGRALTLRTRAWGSLPLSFQWLLNGEPAAGETNRWLALANSGTNQSGDYQLVVSNPYGAATSAVSSVTVLLPPSIASSPTNASWIAGGSGSLPSQATGTEPLQYQWFRGTTKLADDARLSGTTNNSLSISNVLTSDAGIYTIVVTDPAGSTATASSIVSVIVPPVVTVQPRSVSVPVGLPVGLSASASGTAPLSYRWRLNGVDVPGATSNALNFAAISPANYGDYQLVVTNLGGAATSAVAHLTIGPVATWGNGSGKPLDSSLWPASGLSNVIAIAAGSGYSLGLRADGIVQAWGGIGVAATNVPASLFGIVGIAAGPYHALAIRSNGTVVAWGLNSSGVTNVPAGLSNVVAVTAGTSHSAALRADGTVVVWGGTAREAQTNIPPGLTKVAAIDAGGSQTLALREDGTLAGWGGSMPSPVPAYLSGVVAVSAGTMLNSQLQGMAAGASLALLANGSLAAWSGLGTPTNLPPGLTNLIAVESAGGTDQSTGYCLVLRSNGTVFGWGSSINNATNLPAGLSNVVAIAGGVSHALALVNDGRPLIVQPPIGGTFCSGAALALKAKALGNAPLTLQWFKDGNPLDGATNATLTLPAAQFADTGHYCLTASNTLGVAQSVAVPVDIVDSAPAFMLPPANGMAFYGSPFMLGASVIGSGPMELTWLRDNSLVASGTDTLAYDRTLPSHGGAYQLVASNFFGAVTSSVAQITFSRIASWGSGPSPTNAPFDVGSVLGVASGGNHALAIRPNRTVAAWGMTGIPAVSVPAGLSNVIAVSGGNNFSLALKSDGTVAAWGVSFSGVTNVPVNLSNVVAISAGGVHSLALRADGTVAAWGTSASGVTNVPAGLSNVVAVAAGSTHSLALKSDGTLAGWGLYGKPPGLTNVLAISAGYNHSLALQADGAVLGWSTTGGAYVLPAGLSNIVAISAGGGWQGYTLSVALRANGELVAWGNNYIGQTMVPANLLSATAISAGSSSTLAYLNDRSPAFTVQPWERRVASGTNVTLRALAAGRPPLQYQWFRDGQLLPGATSNYLAFPDTQPAHSGAYQLVTWNDLGTAASTVATLTVAVPPVQLSPLPLTAGVFRFAFNGLPAVLYIIEYRSTLTSGSWTELERRFGAGGLEIVTDKTASGAARFYRVRSLYAPPPSMSAITMSGGALSFSFATVSGAVYVIQYKERLEDPAWLELSRQTGTGAPQQITDVTPDAASRFYRVEVR